MIKLQLINVDIIDDTDTRHGSFGRALIAGKSENGLYKLSTCLPVGTEIVPP